ncbi:MAG: type II secretion system minor pseudopilin GspI [Marinobacter sp.]|uniref:type II secretion system minor pseudopilin GspI n=1 Tax=Marinobacter sp. TaxID=50741 RepID=UPI00299EB757|nr:type II secretion system minor pseudopilin GspI [Marinobacter sp.]MDX1755554.1 type II secretion system minor pseudopilin GspI [Marinobacter sp.]
MKGFTLIEVLVALLVFGLIGTAAAQVGSQYITSYERVRDKTLALWIADNRMNEFRLADTFPDISESTEDLDFGQYRWQVHTSVKGTAEPTIRRIDITISKYPDERSDPINAHALSGFIGEPQ